MSVKVRKGGGRIELDRMHNMLNLFMYRTQFAAIDSGAIGNGTTAGKLRTNGSINFRIDGLTFTKASTDNLWDFTGQTTLPALTFKAFWLYLDASGVASIAAGTAKASAADALLNLPALDTTKSVIGTYVAGAATVFTNALAAQGTITNGVPTGVPGVTSGTNDITELVNF